MDISHLLLRIQLHLLLYGQEYKFYIETAAAAVLVYAGFTDFRTFKIRNDVVLLLLVLYVLLALVDRTWIEILSNVLLAAIMFGVLLWFYAYGLVGGGDVKFVTVACLWIGPRSALPFSVILLVLLGLHLIAVWRGWAPTKPVGDRKAIPYAPSVAGALIGVILLGRL